MSRELWLADRKKGIGGTDAATIMHFDEHRTVYELFLEKKGLLIGEREDTARMRAGRVLEAAIANLYAEQFGVTLRKKPTPVVHPKYPWMRGNLDRTIVGARALLEVKNVDGFVFRNSGDWGEDDTDQVPLYYLTQVAHYLAITGLDVAFFAVLVGGNDLHRFVVRRDLELEELLIDAEAQFWLEHVEKDIAPPVDFAHASALSLMRRRYPGSDGRIIDLPVTALDIHAEIIEGRELEKRGKAIQDEGKARLLDLMQGASVGRLPGNGEYRYSNVHRAAYEVQATDYVTLRHCKTPKARAREIAHHE